MGETCGACEGLKDVSGERATLSEEAEHYGEERGTRSHPNFLFLKNNYEKVHHKCDA